MDGIKYLLKFGKRHHVKEFVEGSLYCSDAVTFWGIEDKLKLRGQGDILEAGSRIFAQRMMITEHGTNNTTVINMKSNGLVHIDPAKHMPVFCMFAAGENDCSVDEKGNLTIVLPENVKQAIRDHFPNADAVGIIKDPDAFIQDVENTIGCEVKHEKVHYFHIDEGLPVNGGKDTAMDMEYMMYLTQDNPPVVENRQKIYSFLADYAYRVLFCKDVFFEDEQEYRIVLPNETISCGTHFPVHIRQKIEIMSLDDFLEKGSISLNAAKK